LLPHHFLVAFKTDLSAGLVDPGTVTERPIGPTYIGPLTAARLRMYTPWFHFLQTLDQQLLKYNENWPADCNQLQAANVAAGDADGCVNCE